MPRARAARVVRSSELNGRVAESNVPAGLPQDVGETQALLRSGDYLAGRDLATVV